MKYKTTLWITLMMCVVLQIATAQQNIDLSGTWSFELDDERAGELF